MPETKEQITSLTSPNKMAIGWFTFTCSEDSTILFTELLNDHYDEWTKLVEFRHIKSLKTNNSLKDLDVAFIEGAISSETQEKEVKEIRDNAKYVVAVGACACTGLPSASRNEFTTENMTQRIQWYFNNFDYNAKVKKLEDVVKVDDKVPGCPMSADTFIEILKKYLKIYNLI